MNDKRQIKGAQYNVSELVQKAITAADSQPLNLENARGNLARLGHRDLSDELLARYARESAILDRLAGITGNVGFCAQVGKIDFSSTEKAVSGVSAYLSRRNQAHRARWTESHRGY